MARPAVAEHVRAWHDLGARAGEPVVADCYRAYFTAAITVVLTAGASWGAWLLWKIGFAESFTGIGIAEVNAHGHAQIAGWVGLFIMGFSYSGLPWLWNVRSPVSRLAILNLGLMLIGLILRTVGMAYDATGTAALIAVLVGGTLEMTAIACFCVQMSLLARRSGMAVTPHGAFVLAALLCFAIQAVFGLVHTVNTMTAASRETLLWHVATYQAVLRDLQIHGLTLLMILGVSLRLLPTLFGVPTTPDRRAWTALVLLGSAVVMEVAFYLAYRHTGRHALAGLLLLPWVLLPIGAGLLVWPWSLWRPLPKSLPGGKFIRAGYAWLFLSLAMLVLLPVYQWARGIPFSHAYYGAIRHAITVGFVSMMIVGVSSTVVPLWRGLECRRLSGLWGPFVLLNLGCSGRVLLQTLTDWTQLGFRYVGVSGVLEVAALAWWAAHLLTWMRIGRIVETIDADALLEQGEHPIGKMQTLLAVLRPREMVCLVASFHPEPLLQMVKQKGFEVHHQTGGEGRSRFFIGRP